MITDKSVKGRFLDIIKLSKTVASHHSHPEDQIIFFTDNKRYGYSIGRDAYSKDEFWLSWDSYLEQKILYKTIKHFHSEEMTDWLKQQIVNRN